VWQQSTICCCLATPCRFDRTITVDTPDIKGRDQIFKVHLGKLKLEKAIEHYAGEGRCCFSDVCLSLHSVYVSWKAFEHYAGEGLFACLCVLSSHFHLLLLLMCRQWSGPSSITQVSGRTIL
jgi:hypothetical protein